MREAGIIEDDAPFSRGLPWRIAGVAVQHLGKGGDPGDAIVPHIPDQSQGAATLQHAKDLARRLGVVEPVKGGRTTDEAGETSGSGDRLGGADRHLHARKTIDGDTGSHLLDRLDGKDALAGQRQELRELPRARAQVDDPVGERQVGEQSRGVLGASRDVLAHLARVACCNRGWHAELPLGRDAPHLCSLRKRWACAMARRERGLTMAWVARGGTL